MLRFLPESVAAHHRMMQQCKFRALLKWIDHGREGQRALQRLRNGIIQWMFKIVGLCCVCALNSDSAAAVV